MAAALLTDPRPASRHQPWPRVALCPCGTEVLLARGPRPHERFRLELAEVLPPTKCTACHGTGRVLGEQRHITTGRGSVADGKSPNYALGPVACSHCAGTGQRGEQIGSGHILVSALDGIARPYTDARSGWEAAHRRHRCAADRAMTAAA